MRTPIKKYSHDLTKEFKTITNERKIVLDKITKYMNRKRALDQVINLVYICTHNSRRSHFGQIWAHVAANYYNVKQVNTFSGGTEATAFNVNAINAMKRIGFDVKPINIEKNPTYHLVFDEKESPIVCFSKVFDDPKNPQNGFAAIMTCSDAEQNCPFIPGVEIRVGTPYNDPKEFDNTPLQDAKYDECCRQIALETFYVFSNVK